MSGDRPPSYDEVVDGLERMWERIQGGHDLLLDAAMDDSVPTHIGLARGLKALREVKDRAANLEKWANAQLEDLGARLSDHMLATGSHNFGYGGKTFFLKTDTRANAKPECKEELYQWLKDHGYPSMVYETVNANKLTSFVKELDAESDGHGLPDGLGDLVNVHTKKVVGMNAGRKKGE